MQEGLCGPRSCCRAWPYSISVRRAQPNGALQEANATYKYMGGLQHLCEAYQPARCTAGGKPHLALWSLRACSICCSSVLCLQEGTQADLILQGLEACSICLRILVAPGMPKQIFREDVIELMLDLTRFQLLHSVLVFHDERIRQANKLSAGQGEQSLLACFLAPQGASRYAHARQANKSNVSQTWWNFTSAMR